MVGLYFDKWNLKMKKIILSCFVFLFVVAPCISQTYVYDPNLKLSSAAFKELSLVSNLELYSPNEIQDEFNANEIRFETNFKKKIVLIRGEVAFIKKINNANIIGFELQSDSIIKKHLVVVIFANKSPVKGLYFDSINNYSVGNYVDITAIYSNKDDNNIIFAGNLLHSRYIYGKKNFMVKFINLPEGTEISIGDEISNKRFTKASDNKSFFKFLDVTEYVNLNLTFSDKYGDVIRRRTIKTKINCISIFDYNRL